MRLIPKNRRIGREGTKGFTLLEVLLSAVILAGLMVLLLAMVNRTFTLWGDGQRRREQQREAQASLRMIGEDLRSAVIVTNIPASLLIRTEKGNDTLFFLVSHPDDQRQPGIKGDLCATGYFTAIDPSGNGERNLYRFHASGDEVAQAVEERTLEHLYTTALPGRTNTELLARDIAVLQITPVSPTRQDRHPEALRVSVTALNRAEMRRATKRDASRQPFESLLRSKGTSLSSVIILPPPRESTGTR
jgi:prepilin-type N-terminal cleavage/methylation domain-containing protein